MFEIIYLFISAHITIVCSSLYLHRGQAHRLIKFHPVVEHLIRFWLWITTGMVTKHWVAIHRLHHQCSDRPGDPHSPVVDGLNAILIKSSILMLPINIFHKKLLAKELSKIESYGAGTPDDWIERNVYTPNCRLGILLLLTFNITLFGIWGIVIWIGQLLCFPFVTGTINGLGHHYGYRNYDTHDNSRNVCRIGIFVGGDELHNNHHKYPAQVKLSHKKNEFDIGWFYLKILITLGLAKLTKGS